MTLRELKAELQGILKEKENPQLEARVIIKHLFSLSDVSYILRENEPISADDEKRAIETALERKNGKPSAYILGHREFFGLDYTVDENVLIPRPETELLVEYAINEIKDKGYRSLLDLCTGSGAIGIAIEKNTGIDVVYADISSKALAIAKENHRRLIGDDGSFILSDLFENIEGRFDIIVTNPPYISPSWYEGLEVEVKREPRLALIDKDEDGLGIIRRIISKAPEHLNHDGTIAIESDYRQVSTIKELLSKENFTSVSVIRDLSGKERHTVGKDLRTY